MTLAMAEQVVIDASVGIAHLHDEVGTVAVDAALLALDEPGARSGTQQGSLQSGGPLD